MFAIQKQKFWEMLAAFLAITLIERGHKPPPKFPFGFAFPNSKDDSEA